MRRSYKIVENLVPDGWKLHPNTELNAWLGRVSDKPVHIATPDTDLAAELQRGIAFAEKAKEQREG